MLTNNDANTDLDAMTPSQLMKELLRQLPNVVAKGVKPLGDQLVKEHATLLAALHDNALAQRIGAEAADLDQD